MVKKIISIILIVCTLLVASSCSVGESKSDKITFTENAMANYLKDKYEFEDVEIQNLEFERAKKYGDLAMEEFAHAIFVVEGKTYKVVSYAPNTYKSYYGDDFEKEKIVTDIKKHFEKSFKDQYEYFNIDYYSKLFKQIKEYAMPEDFPDEWFSCVINEKYNGDYRDFFSSLKWKDDAKLDGIFLNITVGFANVKTIDYDIDKDKDNLWVGYMNILNFKNKASVINKNFRIGENLAYTYPLLLEFYTIGDYSSNPTVRINGYQKVDMKNTNFCSYVNLTNRLYVCGQEDVSIKEKGALNVPYDNEAGAFYYIPVKNIENFDARDKFEVSYILNDGGEGFEVARINVDLKENLKYNDKYIMIEGVGESDGNLLWYLIRK